jgi:hypothetical protein
MACSIIALILAIVANNNHYWVIIFSTIFLVLAVIEMVVLIAYADIPGALKTVFGIIGIAVFILALLDNINVYQLWSAGQTASSSDPNVYTALFGLLF